MTRIPSAAFVLIGILAPVYACCAVAPLVPDETYYLAWSHDLQLGYVDHPPMIAYVLALSHAFGSSPFAARLPIVALEAVAALALGYATMSLGGGPRAALLACGACALMPTERWIAVHALPDAPYLAGWAVSLACAAALWKRPTSTNALLLGCALAFAVLSRTFGWALVAGIVCAAIFDDRRSVKRVLPISLAVVAVAIVPWIVWNAEHAWANLVFTTVGRTHVGFRASNVARLATIRAALVAVPAIAIAWFTTVRDRRPLLAWTSLPLPVVLEGLAPFYRIESYFFLGPLLSVAVAVALSLEPDRRRTLRFGVVAVYCAAWIVTLPAAIVPALSPPALADLRRFARANVVAAYAGEASRLTRLASVLEAARDGRIAGAAIDRNALYTDTLAVAAPVTHAGFVVALFGPSPQACEWNSFEAIRPAIPAHVASVWLLSDYAPRDFHVPTGTFALRSTKLDVPDDIGRVKRYALVELGGPGLRHELCKSF